MGKLFSKLNWNCIQLQVARQYVGNVKEKFNRRLTASMALAHLSIQLAKLSPSFMEDVCNVWYSCEARV